MQSSLTPSNPTHVIFWMWKVVCRRQHHTPKHVLQSKEWICGFLHHFLKIHEHFVLTHHHHNEYRLKPSGLEWIGGCCAEHQSCKMKTFSRLFREQLHRSDERTSKRVLRLCQYLVNGLQEKSIYSGLMNVCMTEGVRVCVDWVSYTNACGPSPSVSRYVKLWNRFSINNSYTKVCCSNDKTFLPDSLLSFNWLSSRLSGICNWACRNVRKKFQVSLSATENFIDSFDRVSHSKTQKHKKVYAGHRCNIEKL